ncbi:MAG: orotidine-5'-phosphate decarboxylase [Elusimicrobia bacterium]|nr:orotidine-5'-phosphate decarboxylase [Elusimicrobiota bacterium]
MKLIVALDVDNISAAEKLINLLKKDVEIFKVGSRLFTSVGTQIIDIINKNGCKLFLDLKYYDIPSVIADAVSNAGKKKVFSTSLHISGGREMLKRSVDVKDRPLLWGITVLTSFDEDNLKEIGISKKIEEQVEVLAKIAKETGLDGVVCSAKEIEIIKKVGGLKVIVPGIRLTAEGSDDQKRILTPKKAKEFGADYIVVGRPIIKSEDPLSVARSILKEV